MSLASIDIYLISGVLVPGLLIFHYFYQRHHRKLLREKEQLRNSYESEILKSRLEIQEQTFRHISQEIHDNIGQMLSLAKLNLSTMDLSKPEQSEQKVVDSRKLVSQAIYDLRNLSHGLSTNFVADLGLVRALQREVDLIRKSGEYETTLEVDGTPYLLDKQHELIIYRIFQQTLNNIIKHAASQKIIIHLRYDPSLFTLRITDDGKGFDLTPLNHNTSVGLGIKNMHDRARLIGAAFQISSTLDEGTSVSLSVPVVTVIA